MTKLVEIFILILSSLLLSPNNLKLEQPYLITAYDTFDQAASLSAHPKIAGFYIRPKNIADIQQLTNLRLKTGLPPLVFATDQEGGIVERLTPPLTKNRQLKTSMTNEEIEKYAASQAAELKAIGINLNLAPVVDVYQPKLTYTGPHTRISERSFGTDSGQIARVATTYVTTFQKYGIQTAAKHFPGIGSISKDTHLELDYIAKLNNLDLEPFMALASNSSTLWMLSHAILEEYDSSRSASFSSEVVIKLIKEKLVFKGKLITDDMGMGAIANPVEAITLAHQAGIDYVLLVTNFQKILPEILPGQLQ